MVMLLIMLYGGGFISADMDVVCGRPGARQKSVLSQRVWMSQNLSDIKDVNDGVEVNETNLSFCSLDMMM